MLLKQVNSNWLLLLYKVAMFELIQKNFKQVLNISSLFSKKFLKSGGRYEFWLEFYILLIQKHHFKF